MAGRKQIPKASDVLEKQQSDAAKRAETLSIFFAEGETFHIEGAPELLETLNFKMYARDAQGDTHLADVSGELVRPGAFKATVPDLYAQEELPTYSVCGVPIPARSYTQDEYFQWRDIAQKRKLAEGQAKMQEIRVKLAKANASPVDAEAAQSRLPAFTEARDRLIKEEAKDPFSFAESEKEAQLELSLRKIAELRAVIDQGLVEPIQRLQETSGLGDDYDALERNDREAQLEFVHTLAKAEGLTKESFEAWRKRATGADFANCEELLSEGNDYWLFGKDAEPLSRTERRKLMREVSKELRKAAKVSVKAPLS